MQLNHNGTLNEQKEKQNDYNEVPGGSGSSHTHFYSAGLIWMDGWLKDDGAGCRHCGFSTVLIVLENNKLKTKGSTEV